MSGLDQIKREASALARLFRKAYKESDREALWNFTAALSLYMRQGSDMGNLIDTVESSMTQMYGPLFVTDCPDLSWSLTEVVPLGDNPGGILTHAPIEMTCHIVRNDDDKVFKQIMREAHQSSYQALFENQYMEGAKVSLDVIAVKNGNGKFSSIWIGLDNLGDTSFDAYSPDTSRGVLEDFMFELLNRRHEYTASALYSSLRGYINNL